MPRRALASALVTRSVTGCMPTRSVGTIDCGSRLAGDSDRSGDARLEGLIAGKPAPTGIVDAKDPPQPAIQPHRGSHAI
ncbi:hypothetical protein CCU68_19340 [Pseudomonas gingeri NCPPB 3146 = LMG 5327]|uniref:Uncharacterized protein n=1 Tax=Pseudomonas gingeri NCPPB 3146 = LMG 5327 TaxID=707248 RepID=A0ABX4Y4H8_9PSED|nr:hypothetical protein CCU68_19340 [Pseudomonas gingeri NCPPB 3146 = LMG 5327]